MVDNRLSKAFQLREHAKQSKIGSKCMVIELETFSNLRLRVVTTLRRYLIKTKLLREPRSQRYCYVKPYRPVSRDTVG